MSADTNRKQASAGIIARIGSRINGDVALALLTGVLATLVLAFVFSPEIHQYGDNCGYMWKGISLAEGRGFRPTWWPWGFPVLIGAFYRVAGPRWGALKVLILLSLFTGIYLYARQLKRKGLSGAAASGLLAAVCLSSCIHMVSSYLYSETFFLAAMLFFFVLWEHWQHRLSLLRVIGLSLLGTGVATIRNVGFVVPMSLVIILLARAWRTPDRSQRLWPLIPTALALLYAVAALTWEPLRTVSLTAYFDRLGAPTSVPDSSQAHSGGLVWENAAHALAAVRSLALTLIPQSLLQTIYYPYPMDKPKAVVMLCVTGVVAWGWWRTWKQQAIINLSVALYVAVLLGHGIHYTRLMVPIVPFLFVYLYFGITALVSLAVKKRGVAAALVTVLWLGVVADNAWWSLTSPRKLMPPRAGDDRYQECIEWVVGKAEPMQTVMSHVSYYLLIRGRKPGVSFPQQDAPEAFIEYMNHYKVRYVMVPSWRASEAEMFAWVLATYPERFRHLYGPRQGARVLEYLGGGVAEARMEPIILPHSSTGQRDLESSQAESDGQ